jgi:hypothetical protein
LGIKNRASAHNHNDHPGLSLFFRDLVYKNFNKKIKIEKSDQYVITILYSMKNKIIQYDKLYDYLKIKYPKFKIMQVYPSKLSNHDEIEVISKTNMLISQFFLINYYSCGSISSVSQLCILLKINKSEK